MRALSHADHPFPTTYIEDQYIALIVPLGHVTFLQSYVAAAFTISIIFVDIWFDLPLCSYAITEAGGVIEAVKKQWHIL